MFISGCKWHIVLQKFEKLGFRFLVLKLGLVVDICSISVWTYRLIAAVRTYTVVYLV